MKSIAILKSVRPSQVCTFMSGAIVLLSFLIILESPGNWIFITEGTMFILYGLYTMCILILSVRDAEELDERFYLLYNKLYGKLLPQLLKLEVHMVKVARVEAVQVETFEILF